MASRGRKRTTALSLKDICRLVSKRPDCPVDCMTAIKIGRMIVDEMKEQIKQGHCLALGRIGYFYPVWRKGYTIQSGKAKGKEVKGRYIMRFKFTSTMRRLMDELDYGDYDFYYVDDYPGGIVTENGIARKKREDEEFFKNLENTP